LLAALFRATAERPDLQVLTSPADIRLGPRTVVQPNLFVCRVDPSTPPLHWADLGTPVLAIEILSPLTASRDRGAKRRIYQQAGVGAAMASPSSHQVGCRTRGSDEGTFPDELEPCDEDAADRSAEQYASAHPESCVRLARLGNWLNDGEGRDREGG
jgi:hypothetical protein